MRRLHMTLLLASVAALPVLAEETKVGDADVVTWVDARVKERQPAASDRRFDEVGWTRTLVEAEKLAAKHNRPVFLFTHDGRMNVGRC